MAREMKCNKCHCVCNEKYGTEVQNAREPTTYYWLTVNEDGNMSIAWYFFLTRETHTWRSWLPNSFFFLVFYDKI